MSEPEAGLRVNGRWVALAEVPDDERLLDTIRGRLGLLGTKEGCRSGGCGACTVLVDGRAELSCLLLTHEVESASIRTIEAIGSDPMGERVIAAFARENAVQCGYCTPGFVMALCGLLAERPSAPAEALLAGLEGNLCRCTGYAAIRRAVRSLAGTGSA